MSKPTNNSLLFIALLGMTTVATLAAGWLLKEKMLGIDDAYIFFVYAKNFLLDGQFTYNLGSERVEGFSSALWMLVCIGASAISDDPLIPLLLISLLLSTLIIYLGTLYSEGLVGGASVSPEKTGSLKMVSWIFIGCMFAIPGWFLWNGASLMESPLWNALLACTTFHLLRCYRHGVKAPADAALFTMLLVALILTRPEAPLWVAWYLLAWTAVLRWRNYSGARFAKSILPPLLGAALAACLLLAARLAYFGYPFANTYYAKMSPDVMYNLIEGLAYLGDFCIENAVVVPGIVIALWATLRALPTVMRALLGRDQQVKPFMAEGFLLGGTIMSGLTVVLVTGGDKFGGYRFLQGIYPFLILIALAAAYDMYPRVRATLGACLPMRISLSIAALIAALFSYSNAAGWNYPRNNGMWIEFAIAKVQEKVGQDLSAALTEAGIELPAVGVIAAGGFKYAYTGNVIDLMGLNLTKMAHSSAVRQGIKSHAAFDPEVFYELQPKIVAPRPCLGDWRRPWTPEMFEWQVLKELPGTARFKNIFVYAAFKGIEQKSWMCSYIEVNLLQKMLNSSVIDARVIPTK